MNKYFYAVALVLSAAVLSGCATVADNYVSPTEGPRSKARFVNMQWYGYLEIHKYDDPGCSIFKTTRMFTLFPPRGRKSDALHVSLGMPFNTYEAPQYREVYLPTQEPLVLFANGYDGVITGASQVHFHYPFQAGHEYEIKYTPISPQGAEITLSEIQYENNVPKMVELKKYPSDWLGSLKDQEGCAS